MVRVVNVSNFDWIVKLPEQWHRKKLIDNKFPWFEYNIWCHWKELRNIFAC